MLITRGYRAMFVVATLLGWVERPIAQLLATHAPVKTGSSQVGGLSKTPTDAASFLKWARSSRVAVGPTCDHVGSLGPIVGDARIVALSEANHGAKEPLEFRNCLLRYLVEEKGFTAIAIESGIVESRVVHTYVREGSGDDLSSVAQKGVGWTFDNLPQNRELIRWLRDYNSDPHHIRKVNFYGFDVPGSPGNPNARRRTDTALVETLTFIDRVDSRAAAVLHSRLDAYLPRIQAGVGSPDVPGYGGLTQAQRDGITSAIADAISLMERNEAEYAATTSQDDYAWAYRAAIAARQTDNFLRSACAETCNAAETQPQSVRDRAQADNLDWIIAQEGSSGKVLVFAHRFHISTAPVEAFWSAWKIPEATAGAYLRARYGNQLLSIGNLMGSGSITCAAAECCADLQVLDRSAPDTLEGIASKVGPPAYLLDTRAAPSSVRKWLNQTQAVGHGDGRLLLSVGHAFDVLFFLDMVKPACSQVGGGS